MNRKIFKMLAFLVTLSMLAACAPAATPPAEEAPAPTPAQEEPAPAAPAPTPALDEEQSFFKVGKATITMAGTFFVALADSLANACYEHGLIASPDDLLVLDAGWDHAREIENIDTFIAQGYDLIFVNSTNPYAVVDMIDRAAAAGIIVICIDSYVSGGDRVTVVYSDNEQNGRQVGLEFVNEVGDMEIYSIMLSGVRGNIAGEQRRTGLMAGVLEARLGVSEEEAWTLAHQMNSDLIANGYAEHTEAGFIIDGQGWGNWSITDILQDANDLIVRTYGSLNTIFAENDQMLFGGMQAAEDAGLEGILFAAAADGELRTFDYIREGRIVAVGQNSPVRIGEVAARIAHEVLVQGVDPASYPDTVTTPAVAVTRRNVDEQYQFGF